MATLRLSTDNHYTITTAGGDSLVIVRDKVPGRKGIAGGKIVLETGEYKSAFLLEGVSTEAGAALVTPPVGSIAYTGFIPTVTAISDNDIEVIVPVGAVSYTGLAPTVTATDNQSVTIPVGAISYSGLAPTVTAGDNQSVEVPAGAITYTGYAPDVIYLPNPIILSVVPSAFDDGKTGVVITTENVVTAGATVKIGGVEQSVTGTTANTITITTERGTTSLGSARLEVIAA